MDGKHILVADDHTKVLEEVRAVLGKGGDIVATVESGEALVQAAEDLHPDLIITDISMPGMSGFMAVEKIRERGVSAKVIFLTVHSASGYVRKARALGARGYILKIQDFEHLPEAVAAVLSGKTYFSPQFEAAGEVVRPSRLLEQGGVRYGN